MPIIANSTERTDEKGVIAIVVSSKGFGKAINVYQDDYGYSHEWVNVESATVFDTDKVKTLEDIERLYDVDLHSYNQGNSVKIIGASKTTSLQTVVIV